MMDKFDAYFALAGRLLLAQIFVFTAVGKMTGDAAPIVEYMESFGVPGLLYWPSTVFELAAGLAVLAGYQTRIAALLLAGFCLLTTLLFHTDISNNMQMGLLLRNIALAGGFLVLARSGAGPISVERWLAIGAQRA